MKTINLIIALVLLSLASIQAQYQNSYGDIGNERGYSIQPVIDSKLIIAGSIGPDAGNIDAMLLKTDTNGSEDWAKTYGGEAEDAFYSVRYIYDNELLYYVAVGQTMSYGSGSSDVYLVAADFNGNQVFTRVYGGRNYDKGNCVQVVTTPLSEDHRGFIIVGTTESFNDEGRSEIYIILTDLNGSPLKSVVFGDRINMEGSWIEQTHDGGFIFTGYAETESGKRIFTAKLDFDLNPQWHNIYFTESAGEGLCIKEDPAGDFVITGFTTNKAGEDAFLMILDSTGGVKKMMSYDNGPFDKGHNILVQEDADGEISFVVCGRTLGAGMDGMLFRTRKDLNLLWSMKYGLEDEEEAYELCPGPGGGYFFSGKVQSIGAGYDDIYLVFTDPIGQTGTICDAEFPLAASEQDVRPEMFGRTELVGGTMQLFESERDLYLVRDSCRTENPEPYKEKSSQSAASLPDKSFSVYPSPASSVITVGYSSIYYGGEIRILDITGKIIIRKEITNNESTDINISNLPEGLYMLSIFNGQKNESVMFTKE